MNVLDDYEFEPQEWESRYDLLSFLTDKAMDMASFFIDQIQYGDEYNYKSRLYMDIAEILLNVQKLIRTEKYFIDLADEVTDSKNHYLVQKYLHDFIEERLYPDLKDTIKEISDRDFLDEYNNQYKSHIVNLLGALLESYELLYL